MNVDAINAIRSAAELPPHWFAEWGERAAIREYDGCQSRTRAEVAALAEIKERMKRNTDVQDNESARSDAGRCRDDVGGLPR